MSWLSLVSNFVGGNKTATSGTQQGGYQTSDSGGGYAKGETTGQSTQVQLGTGIKDFTGGSAHANQNPNINKNANVYVYALIGVGLLGAFFILRSK